MPRHGHTSVIRVDGVGTAFPLGPPDEPRGLGVGDNTIERELLVVNCIVNYGMVPHGRYLWDSGKF